MKIRAQIAMVLNLDKCIGCHTCSVTCKQAWTNRAGTEYVWFNNVELVAAEKIGRETVTYVSNIYKYYLAYQMVEEERAEREKIKEAVKGGTGK